ncbi:efflux RND transporter permease subunit [Deltaproteobacteria bacterium PRO3]|nr:efflux RND transporter permease subunit [Deltaproteobacteria bacterium PRO3]
MIEGIVKFSVKNQVVVLVLTAIFLAAGGLAYTRLSVDALPDITNVQVTVNTMVEGLAPEESERYVTAPIEAAMNGISSVTHLRSLTKFGLSQVTVNFEDGTDIYQARQQVAERLQTVLPGLPPGLQPRLGPITTGLGEIYFYTVEAEKVETGEARRRQLMELRALQEWLIRPRLLTVKGVAGVDTTGGYEKQFHVQPDIQRMSELGIGFDEIEKALAAANRNAGGGYIQQDGRQLIIQALGLFQSPEDIAQVPVLTLSNLKTVKLGDIAKVELGYPLRVGAALVDGREAILGMVYLMAGDNSRKVARAVDAQVEEIRKVLPPGIRIETLYDRSELVDATLRTVLKNLGSGALLVVAVLLLMVGNLRAALITAAMIPLSLLFTFILMNYFGISGNLMSLGALDFGIIVDGAVIVLENCVRRTHARALEKGAALTRAEVRDTVLTATVETRRSAGFGELVILVVFIPIFALGGIEGKMFQPMAAAFAFAILGALIFSFTTAPALASLLLKGSPHERQPWLMRGFQALYRPLLDFSLRFRGPVLAFGAILVGLALWLFLRMGSEFVPQLNEGSIVIMLHRDANIGVDAAVEMQARSEKIIREFPEVKRVFSRIGTAEAATDPMGIYLADTFLMLKESKEWPKVDGRRRTKDELAEAVVAKLQTEIPGQDAILTQPIQMRFNELLEGTRSDVAVKLFGDDLNQLLELSAKAEELLKEIPGAGDVEAEMSDTSPVLQIRPRRATLEAMGLSTGVVLEAVETALGGKELGYFFEGVRRFPIVLRLDEASRSDVATLKRIPVEVGPNLTLRLDELAEVAEVEGFATIFRENGRRRTAILVNPRDRDTEGFVLEAQRVLRERLPLPEGMYFEWGGNFKNLQQARNRLMVLSPIVLALIFVMIYVVFRSATQTLLIFTGVPFALVGGVLALYLRDMPFSISAGVGFIALSGIAILNGVVLISTYHQLGGGGLGGKELARQGALLRLRPVLMTALVDVFGFLPMMLSRGIGAEVQRPLATVVIGGVISSTLLTLLLLPAAYSLLDRGKLNRAARPT